MTNTNSAPSKEKEYKSLIIAMVLGAVFLLVYSSTTSPLSYNFIGSDSGFFQAVGRLMHSGRIMYHDVFDQKGPFLFLIEYLGYCFPVGRYGVLLIQAFFMAVNLLLIRKTVWTLNIKSKPAAYIILTVFFLFCLSLYYECGNLTEEYSHPFILLSLYLHFKGIKEKDFKRSYTYIYGICFGILAMIRVTNSVLIDVCMLHCFLMCLFSKKIKDAVLHSLRFIAGALIVAAPFFAYYALKGCLNEFVNAAFVFGYKYATQRSFITRMLTARWTAIVPFLLFGIIAIIVCRKNFEKILFICLTLFFTLIVLFIGNSFVHYSQLLVVPIVAIIFLILDEREGPVKKSFVAMIFAVVLLSNIYEFVTQNGRVVCTILLNTQPVAETKVGQFFKNINDSRGLDFCGYERKALHEDLLSHIPEDCRDSVYAYSGGPQWIYYSNIDPYSKYCETADSFASISPKVEEEILDMFENRPPKYLVTNLNDLIRNPKVKDIVENDYEEVYRNSLLTLRINKEFQASQQ